MKLTDAICANAQVKDKNYKIFDGNGIYLEIMPNGSKYWRFRFRFDGKDKRIAFGIFPATSIAVARGQAAAAKALLAKGIDPTQERKQAKTKVIHKQDTTFEKVARNWHGKEKDAWTKKHADYVISRLESYIFPNIGKSNIETLNNKELRNIIQNVETKGSSIIARRIAQSLVNIFEFAIDLEIIDKNPATSLVRTLKAVKKTEHHKALSASELPEFLNKLELYKGNVLTKLALRFLILTFVRSNELRSATWSEINLKTAEWVIPASRMKNGQKHIVPLSAQAMDILIEIERINFNKSLFIFPNQEEPTKCMSENTLLYALYNLGLKGKTTVHGFRSTASTALNEAGYRGDAIERQLAHNPLNQVRAAYNRASYLPERTVMMQAWADHVIDGKPLNNMSVAA